MPTSWRLDEKAKLYRGTTVRMGKVSLADTARLALEEEIFLASTPGRGRNVVIELAQRSVNQAHTSLC